MIKKLFCISFTMTLLIISILTYAQEIQYTIKLPIYELEDENNINLVWKEVDITGNNTEEKILNTFENLLQLNYNDKKIKLIPEETKILSAYVDGDEVQINFSSDILNYGGATWEYYLVNQLLLSSFVFDDIDSVSFYIDDGNTTFVEGTEILNYTRNDLKKRIDEDAKNK